MWKLTIQILENTKVILSEITKLIDTIELLIEGLENED